MTDADFFWLVGLLEGEGSFMRGPPSRPNRVIVRLQMSDGDVVYRAAKIMNGPKVWYGDNGRRGRERGWKKLYSFQLTGRKAVDLMKLLEPHMGERRRAKIQEILVTSKYA